VYLWDVESWRLARRFEEPHPEPIWTLDLSPDGRLAVTGGLDPLGLDRPAHVVIWDLKAGTALRTIRLPHAVMQVAFSPDGSLVAAANRANGVKLWRVAELREP
jgi:WD40 repeat protein